MQALTPKNLPQQTEDRLNMFFTAANKLNLKGSNEHLLKDYALFFARFPGYENRDKIELLLGDSYRNNGDYFAALSKYDKVWKIYPSTKYKAASLRMKGDIYASELKNREKAMKVLKSRLYDYYNSKYEKEYADKVAALPYDVMNSAEAAEMVKGNPYSFLHVDKAEIDLPEGTDHYSEQVYLKAKENLDKLVTDAGAVALFALNDDGGASHTQGRYAVGMSRHNTQVTGGGAYDQLFCHSIKGQAVGRDNFQPEAVHLPSPFHFSTTSSMEPAYRK